MSRLELMLACLVMGIGLFGTFVDRELAGLIGLFVAPVLCGWFGYKMYEFVHRGVKKNADTAQDV